MIHLQYGDLLESDADIIAHQVNCQGVMGSGVAKQIRNRFPQAYIWYRRTVMADYNNREKLLGTMQYVLIQQTPPKYIANLFGQYDYGSMGGRTEPFTSYSSLKSALLQLSEFADNLSAVLNRKVKIALPFKIGCARGGGDWEIVKNIINETLSDQDVTLYQL